MTISFTFLFQFAPIINIIVHHYNIKILSIPINISITNYPFLKLTKLSTSNQLIAKSKPLNISLFFIHTFLVTYSYENPP